jgi:flagellar hook assembly protein FlgD
LLRGEPLLAGPVSVPWDGRDDRGSALPPGHYLCRIKVKAHNPVTITRLVGVAY